MNNTIKKILIDSGVCEESSIEPFHEKVRDRQDISVLICNRSGVIFLSTSEHMDFFHYSQKKDLQYWSAENRSQALLACREDTYRKFDQFKNIITNKRWIDIGTGTGGILDLLSPLSLTTTAVEPQQGSREMLEKLGYAVYSSIDEVQSSDFEVVTLFHVFEHFTHPIEMLGKIKDKMASGGIIVLEVPHAKDFLISFFNLEAFKSFTFWSEHLILHTRESLRIFLEIAGFSNISISGHQRYPLANHLHWLAKAQPGGHLIWDHLRTPKLDNAYSDMLNRLDQTDTLIAIASKP